MPAHGDARDRDYYKDFSYEPPAKKDDSKPWTRGGTVSRILYHPVTGAKTAIVHYELLAHDDKQDWDEARVMRATTHCAPLPCHCDMRPILHDAHTPACTPPARTLALHDARSHARPSLRHAPPQVVMSHVLDVLPSIHGVFSENARSLLSCSDLDCGICPSAIVNTCRSIVNGVNAHVLGPIRRAVNSAINPITRWVSGAQRDIEEVIDDIEDLPGELGRFLTAQLRM